MPRDFKPGPGQSLCTDGWDGDAPARMRLTGALRKQRVANPVLLGVDVHENRVGHVQADHADPASAAVGVESCDTSISARSGGGVRMAERLTENPHFVYADGERRGYGIADITPPQMAVSLRVVSDVSAKDATIEALARFTVQAATPKVERA